MSKSKKITKSDVKRIQGTVAKQNGGKIEKGSYVSRLQKAVAKESKNV